MFSFILQLDYFTMAENRKHFWKSFYMTVPMEISGSFDKHFNAATVRACLTMFDATFIFGNVSYSNLQQGCHYITLSLFIFRGDM
jgi:hypothetical protein